MWNYMPDSIVSSFCRIRILWNEGSNCETIWATYYLAIWYSLSAWSTRGYSTNFKPSPLYVIYFSASYDDTQDLVHNFRFWAQVGVWLRRAADHRLPLHTARQSSLHRYQGEFLDALINPYSFIFAGKWQAHAQIRVRLPESAKDTRLRWSFWAGTHSDPRIRREGTVW